MLPANRRVSSLFTVPLIVPDIVFTNCFILCVIQDLCVIIIIIIIIMAEMAVILCGLATSNEGDTYGL